MTHRRGRLVLCSFGVLMVIAFVVAACEGDISEPSINSPTADSWQGSTVGELIASPDSTSFTVTLRPRGQNSTDEVIVWRQGGGFRRWDVVREHSSPELGSFEVQSRVDDNGGSGAAEESCDWDQYGDSVQAHVSCGEGSSDPALMDIDESMLLPVHGPAVTEQVHGRQARCYAFAREGSFCVDAALRVPLRFAVVGLEFEATSVDTTAVSLSLPIQLTLNPELEPLKIREADTSVRLDQLQLPRMQ